MSREYEPLHRGTRLAIVAAAAIVAAIAVGLLLGLDVHYDREFVHRSQAAAEPSASGAPHAGAQPASARHGSRGGRVP